MDSRFKWPLANFCYAAIAFVAGGLVVAIGKANEGSGAGDALTSIGGLAVLVGVVYLLVGLWHLSQAVLASDEADDD